MLTQVLIVLALVSSPTWAADLCEEGTSGENRLAASSFKMMGPHNNLTVISEPAVSDEEKKQIDALLRDDHLDFNELSRRSEKFLGRDTEVLAELGNLLKFLHDTLSSQQIRNVMVEMPQEELTKQLLMAAQTYLGVFQLQIYGSARDVRLDYLMLLEMSAPIYLKTVQPELFALTALEGLPSIRPAKAKTKPQKEKPSNRNAEKAYEELRAELRPSSASARQAARIRSRIHGHEFHDLSSAEIIHKVLPYFWRPARHHVEAWLKVELATHDREESPPKENEVVPTPVRALLAKRGNNIVLLKKDHYEEYKAEICDSGH